MVSDDGFWDDATERAYWDACAQEEAMMQCLTEIYIDDSLVLLDESVEEIVLNGQTIYYREGELCEKDEDGDWYGYWALTWFYTDKDNPADYLYYEQDPPEIAIRNLKHILSQND